MDSAQTPCCPGFLSCARVCCFNFPALLRTPAGAQRRARGQGGFVGQHRGPGPPRCGRGPPACRRGPAPMHRAQVGSRVDGGAALAPTHPRLPERTPGAPASRVAALAPWPPFRIHKALLVSRGSAGLLPSPPPPSPPAPLGPSRFFVVFVNCFSVLIARRRGRGSCTGEWGEGPVPGACSG